MIQANNQYLSNFSNFIPNKNKYYKKKILEEFQTNNSF